MSRDMITSVDSKPSDCIAKKTVRAVFVALAMSAGCSSLPDDGTSALNGLRPTELKQGWELLFDGSTMNGWRGFGKPEAPSQGWVVEGGWLKHRAGGGGGDLITRKVFTDFDLSFEWLIAPGGNSGVKYFIDERRGSPTGHEYQLIDDRAHPDAAHGPKRQTAALYDALGPVKYGPALPGVVHQSRIRVSGRNVEHWLDGNRVLSYELASPLLMAAKAQSKFRDVFGWGTKFPTPILLQDHGDEIWFRNLKIYTL